MKYSSQRKLQYSNASFVYDVIFQTGKQRGNSVVYFLGAANPWIYSHEFGHLLGLGDYYYDDPYWDGPILVHESLPNVETFGDRATRSIMGTTSSAGPTVEDLEDILNPEVTLHEQTAKNRGRI